MDFHIPFQSYLQRYSVKYKALYHAIRDKIISGDWHRGLKLPSSREMAQLYGVSRGSVNQVYDMLLSEGYVIAEVGRGTFVSYKGDRKLGAGKAHQQVRLSNWGVKLQTLAMNDRQSHKIDCDFSLSGPDAGHFPITDWKRCVNQAVRALSESDDIPNGLETEGDLDLREAVSQYLQRSRGVDTTLDRICIVNGSMQAIALLTQLLVDIGDTVIMEEPGYFGMHRAVASVKGSIVTTGLDQQGMLTPREHAKLALLRLIVNFQRVSL